MNLLERLSSLDVNFFKVRDEEGKGELSIYLFSDLISSNFDAFFGFHGRSVSSFTLPLHQSPENLLSNPCIFEPWVIHFLSCYLLKINSAVFMFPEV